MITPEIFDTEFEKLQSAFGVSKSEKIKDGWHAEFEGYEPVPFQKAMHRCQYGERFPNWATFKAEYLNCVDPSFAREQGVEGCNKCQKGRIPFLSLYTRRHRNRENKIVEGKEIKELIGFCLNCVPSKEVVKARAIGFYAGLPLVNPQKLFKDESNAYWLPEALAFANKEGKIRRISPVLSAPNVNNLAGGVGIGVGKYQSGKETKRKESLAGMGA